MNKTAEKRLNIGDLAQLSGVSKSTVHHYLNIGLLHPARKVGLGTPVYDWSHLSRLKRIVDLRVQQKLPLSSIQKILDKEGTHSSSISQKSAESMIKTLEKKKRANRARKNEIKRIEIMDAAIALFSKVGYEKTTLEAIADSLNIAKSTVYLYFENKENLFMECIERLTVVTVPEEAWDELRMEKNPLQRLIKRGLAFHRSFPNYKGILNMTKAVLGGDNEQLSEKAKTTLFLMTRPIAKDIRRGVAEGIFRDIDEEIAAHLILAMGEGIGFRLMMDSRYTIEQAVETMYDIVSHGVLKNNCQSDESPEQEPCGGEVVDLKGVSTRVANIFFGDRKNLSVKIGEAEVRVEPNKLKSLRFQEQGQCLIAEITDHDDQIQTAEVEGTTVLTGQVHLGQFVIKLNKVANIVFNQDEI
jgi:TetR/AcrR family transcriptional regulator